MNIAPLQGRGLEVKALERPDEAPRQNHAENEPRRADRAKPDHGRKRAYQQAHTGRGFSENAGAASRTGRGAASRGGFPVLSLVPCVGAFFKAAGRSRRARHGAYRRGADPESVEKGCPAGAGSGSVKGAAVPSAIYRRGTGNAGAGKVHQEIGQSRRPSGRSAGGTSPKEEIAAAI